LCVSKPSAGAAFSKIGNMNPGRSSRLLLVNRRERGGQHYQNGQGQDEAVKTELTEKTDGGELQANLCLRDTDLSCIIGGDRRLGSLVFGGSEKTVPPARCLSAKSGEVFLGKIGRLGKLKMQSSLFLEPLGARTPMRPPCSRVDAAQKHSSIRWQYHTSKLVRVLELQVSAAHFIVSPRTFDAVIAAN